MNINSILVFLLLNLLWIIILYLSLGVFYKKKNPNILYILFFVFGILAVVLSVTVVLDYTETNEFCADTCHPMEDYGDSYFEEEEDAEENTILGTHRENDVGCADCHNKPGVVGIVKSKYAGVMEVYKFATGQYEEPLEHPEVGEEFCAKSGCHDEVDWLIQGVETNETSDGLIDHPDLDEYEICNDCHAPHQEGIKLKTEGCTVCHNVTEDELYDHEEYLVEGEQFLEIIEDKTDVETCGDCHETMDKIPYKTTTPNEFCQSCHDDEFSAYSGNITVNQTAFYGGCVECHTEHKEKQELHPILPEVDCVVCHTNYNEDITIHDPSEISYKTEVANINDEFCASCHIDEFNAYQENGTIEQLEFYGGCVDCHTDHDETKELHPVLEEVECEICHTNYDEDIQNHNPSGISYGSKAPQLDNAFCSGCHSEEFSAYSGNLTVGQREMYGENCVDCHSEHDDKKELHSVPGDLNCWNCHASYNEEIKTHDPSQVSYKSVSSQFSDDFCNRCHEEEFNAYYENEDQNEDRLKIYGDCLDCHSDHDVKTKPHSSDTQYENCVDCHTKYNEEVKTHTLDDVDYGSMDIENEFCSSCHEGIYEGFSEGSIQDRSCVECHSNHEVNIVNKTDNCSSCHENFKNNHNP